MSLRRETTTPQRSDRNDDKQHVRSRKYHDISPHSREKRRSASPPSYHTSQRSYYNDHHRNRRYDDDDRHHARRHDRDHDRKYYQHSDDDRRGRRNDRESSPRRDEEPVEPNINMVLRGLPDNAEEEDIERMLESMKACVDTVTLIRDRDTGESRKFAFVRFASVGHAVQFYEKHHPYFYMRGHRVRVDYSYRDNGGDHTMEWQCVQCGKFNNESRRVCVECRTRFEPETSVQRSNTIESFEINDGSKDVSQVASSMLLLRNLDCLSTEKSVYSAIKHTEGLVRVLLIRDKLTKMSCEFAFAEFANLQLAAKAKELSYLIDGRTPVVSFANPDSFLPVYVSSEWTIRADVIDGLWVYHDSSAYACEYSRAPVTVQETKETEPLASNVTARDVQTKEDKPAKPVSTTQTLQDDLDAFYADIGDILADSDDHDDVFTVPKSK